MARALAVVFTTSSPDDHVNCADRNANPRRDAGSAGMLYDRRRTPTSASSFGYQICSQTTRPRRGVPCRGLRAFLRRRARGCHPSPSGGDSHLTRLDQNGASSRPTASTKQCSGGAAGRRHRPNCLIRRHQPANRSSARRVGISRWTLPSVSAATACAGGPHHAAQWRIHHASRTASR
jgi:hypothetical protein